MPNYKELLDKALRDHPKDYEYYVVKRNGKTVPAEQGLVFETDEEKRAKRGKSTHNPFNNRSKPVILSKICSQCQEQFQKPMRMSLKDWNERKNCSITCRILSKAK